MRICLYTDTALPKMGVQESAVDALARAYAALGHQAVVLAPWPKPGTPSGDEVPYPVLRHPRFISSHFLTAWYRWFLQNHYERSPFDLLHCHGVHPPAYLAALSRSSIPAPIVVTSHGEDVSEKRSRRRAPVITEQIIEGLRSADALIATDLATHARLAQLCPEAAARIVDIPNGVHLADVVDGIARPGELDADIVPGAYAIFVGRLKYRHGVDVLLQALARTPATERVQLVLVGDGEERALLTILSEQLDLCARVRFLDRVSNPAKQYLLRNARFGVVPARQWDTIGPIILQGFASSLPMIATDLPGWSDLIQPESTGLLVAPEAPDELAEAMTRLFADDALVQRMGVRAAGWVKTYDWQLIAERHLSLYRSLLPARLARAA